MRNTPFFLVFFLISFLIMGASTSANAQSASTDPMWRIDVGKIDNFRQSGDGRFIFVDRHNLIDVLDSSSGKPVSKLLPCKFSATFSTTYDGSILAVNCLGDGGKTIEIWDVFEARLIRKISHKGGGAGRTPKLSPDGKRLLTEDEGDQKERPESLHFSFNVTSFYLWDVSSGNRISLLVPVGIERGEDAYSAEFSPSGRYVVTAYAAGKLSVWRANNGEHVSDLTDLGLKDVGGRRNYAHSGRVYAFLFANDEETLITGGYDWRVKVWNISHGNLVRVFDGHKARLFDIGISADNKKLCSADSNNMIKIWDVVSGDLITTIRPPKGPNICEFTPDGKSVFIGWQPGGALFDLDRGREMRSWADVGVMMAPDKRSVVLYDKKKGSLERRTIQ